MNAKTGKIEMKQKQDDKTGIDRKWLWGVLVALIMFCVAWGFWPSICGHWFKHDECNHNNECHHNKPEVFGSLEVLLVAIATGVGFGTYVNECARRRDDREKEKEERQREAKRTQAAFLSQTVPYFVNRLEKFTVAQDAVTFGDKRGKAALEALLYEPFRIREKVAMAANDNEALKTINHDFLEVCNKIELDHVANPLWDLLNWIMYQQLFWDGISGTGKSEEDVNPPIRNSFLFALKEGRVIPASLQYVFGKYRHLKYNLELLPEDGGWILDGEHGYRGTDYADAVFLYRPTLKRLPESPQKQRLLAMADERDVQEVADLERKRKAKVATI